MKYETMQIIGTIQARKWYTIMLGYGGSESRPFAAVEKTGKTEGGSMSLFGPNAMKIRPMRPVWRMIDADGYETTATDTDLQENGSIGIGSMVPAPGIEDLTDERLAELVEIGKRNREQEKREAEEAARAREELKRKLAREYSYLPNKRNDGYLRTAQVAQNLRVELKRKFPGVKFSVRSSTFSGGDSIDVWYSDGPAAAKVEEIVDRYQDSHADFESGDYWDYDPSAFNDVFGGAKYTSCQRSMSDETKAVLMPGNSYQEWPRERLEDVMGLFRKTDIPVGAVVTGIESGKIKFTVPKATPVGESARNVALAVEVRENPAKHGIEIRFASRPSDDILGKLKANGWRWSRFAGCWYNRASDESRQFANEIAVMIAD